MAYVSVAPMDQSLSAPSVVHFFTQAFGIDRYGLGLIAALFIQFGEIGERHRISDAIVELVGKVGLTFKPRNDAAEFDVELSERCNSIKALVLPATSIRPAPRLPAAGRV